MREYIEVDSKVLFPVFVHVLDEDSVMQFDDVQALRHLEPIDVENGEYEAWDAHGRVLHLTASCSGMGRIKIDVSDRWADNGFMSDLRLRASRR
jgi:hypothetical protein